MELENQSDRREIYLDVKGRGHRLRPFCSPQNAVTVHADASPTVSFSAAMCPGPSLFFHQLLEFFVEFPNLPFHLRI